MTRDEAFPSNILSVDQIEPERTLTIKEIEFETFKYEGQEQRKPVALFEETDKRLPLNRTNWDKIVAVTGKRNSDDWPGERVTFYKDNYWDDRANEAKPCVRVSAIKPGANGKPPTETTEQRAAPKPKRSVAEDVNDDLPPQFRR